LGETSTDFKVKHRKSARMLSSTTIGDLKSRVSYGSSFAGIGSSRSQYVEHFMQKHHQSTREGELSVWQPRIAAQICADFRTFALKFAYHSPKWPRNERSCVLLVYVVIRSLHFHKLTMPAPSTKQPDAEILRNSW